MTIKENDKRITDLEKGWAKASIFMFGNGEKMGLDEKFRNLSTEVSGMKDTQARMESDLKEVKRMMQDVVGYAGVKFDKISHPDRREGDNPEGLSWTQIQWEKATENIGGKFVTAVILYLLLNAQNFWDFFITQLAK
jgi:hypothetical protein